MTQEELKTLEFPIQVKYCIDTEILVVLVTDRNGNSHLVGEVLVTPSEITWELGLKSRDWGYVLAEVMQ